jgi:hypothetical protein
MVLCLDSGWVVSLHPHPDEPISVPAQDPFARTVIRLLSPKLREHRPLPPELLPALRGANLNRKVRGRH